MNRKNRDSRLDAVSPASCKQYGDMREVLAAYMSDGDNGHLDYPSNRQVVDVMDAAGGASEQDVVNCLSYLYHERGLRRGTKNGPRHSSWFKTVVADYFDRKRLREFVFKPPKLSEGAMQSLQLSESEFERMSGA